MGCSAGAGNDDLEPAVSGPERILYHACGRAVCRDHGELEGDAELFEHVCRGLHDSEVAVAAHDNAYEWCAHVRLIKAADARCCGLSSRRRVCPARPLPLPPR